MPKSPATHPFGKRRGGFCPRSALLCASLLFGLGGVGLSAQTIPTTQATALDGHALTLPRDLPGRATVLIVGFGRNSKDATTAWEKPVRQQLAQPGVIGFYDIAMIAEVPGFLRSMVVRSIKHDVPDVLKPNFLPLTGGEDAWKQVAHYDSGQPEAAYVLLVDHAGRVQWATHAPFSQAGYSELNQRAHALASQP